MRLLALLISILVCIGSVAKADPLPGSRWPSFRLVRRGGAPFEWRAGRVTVLSFCAYWCDTWKTQAPRIGQAQSALAGLPIDFYRISVDGRWTELDPAAAGLSHLNDPGGAWARKMDVTRVPTTVVIDAEGIVRWCRSGVVRTADLVREAQGALRARQSGGTIYLTFDDFPAPQGGEELLDVLRAEEVPATFFCIGSKVEANASLLKRAKNEGHELQCHSWDHRADAPQIERCRATMKRVLGVESWLYRAPGGHEIIGMSAKSRVVDPYDFLRPGRDEIIRRVLANVKPGAVIQLHAGVADTLDALPELIRRLKALGYRLQVLPR